jgi:HSP90 family molecular chaperone
VQVLFFYSSIDEFVMQHLSEYKDKRVMNAESEACVVPVGEKATDLEKDGGGDAEKKDKEEVRLSACGVTLL